MIRNMVIFALICVGGMAQSDRSHFMPIGGLRLNTEEVFELAAGCAYHLGDQGDRGMVALTAVGNHKSCGVEAQYILLSPSLKFFIRPKFMKTYSGRTIGAARNWTGTSTALELGIINDVGHMALPVFVGYRNYSDIGERRLYAGVSFLF